MLFHVLSQYNYCIILLREVYYTHVHYCVRASDRCCVLCDVQCNTRFAIHLIHVLWCTSPSSLNSHLPVLDSFKMTAAVTIYQLDHLHSIIIHGALILIKPFSLCKINVTCLIWFPENMDHAAREGNFIWSSPSKISNSN